MGRRSKHLNKKKRASWKRKSSKKRQYSQGNLRKLFEELTLAIEELTAIEVEVLNHALQETDVFKPCCGDGGRQEIKDSSNASRNQSITDDILSGGEDVDTETLGSRRHNIVSGGEDVDSETLGSRRYKKPMEMLWGEWGVPGEDDSDISEDDDTYEDSEKLRLEFEEIWPNMEVDYNLLATCQDFMSRIPLPQVSS